MADYKFQGPTEVDGVYMYDGGLNIPNDPGNRHWAEWLEYTTNGGETDEYQSPEDALTEMKYKVDQQNRNENAKDFPYGSPEYPYVADSDNIQAVAIESAGMTGTDPIPVPNGQWKTNAKDEVTLLPVYVSYTCAEFATFKSDYFMRSSTNFGIKEGHKNALTTMFTGGSTAEQIRGYDYSQGWV